MVYKKYIVRGGKTFGPYYYRSVKKGGKVITQYVKDPGDFPQKKFKSELKKISKNLNFIRNFLIFPLILLILILGFFLIKSSLTGNVILSIENYYVSEEALFGELKLNLEPKEFIPASTNVLINSNEQESVFVLKDLINEQPKQGEFYISGTDVSGFGEGYGIREEAPEVSFTINFFKSKEKDKFDQKGLEENQTNETGIAEIPSIENETEIADIPSVEITEETEPIEEVIEEPSEKTIDSGVSEQDKKIPPGAEKKDENKPVEIPSEKPANKESVETIITGNAIGSFFSAFYLAMAGKVSLDDVETIEGSVSKNKPFIYKLKEDQTVQIIESSQEISFEIIGNEAIITTNYTKNESEYFINLSKLNIAIKDKNLEIKLEYDGIEFYSISKILNSGILNETNQTIQEINFTADNSTIQYGAVLGEPVKWKKTIKVSEQDTIVELPAQAENISVYKIETSNVILNEPITGNLILEYNSDRKGFFSKIAKFITGRAIEITEKTEKIEVNISEEGAEFEVEYETPGPVAFEENTSYGKEVIISSEVHYENVLAYTELPKESNLREIKLYQITDGSYPEGHKKIPVDFVAYNVNNEVVEESNDLDDDVLDEIEKIVNQGNETSFGENKSLIYGEEGRKELDYSVKKIRAKDENLVNYIEWIVPSLSNQTYELILITKAQHLDSNKNFISDIYEEVKALDGNWSEQINDSEYVRVTFEKNLTNQNDITIFPRSNSSNVSIEVYEFNKTEIIAEFTNITSNEYNTVYLTKLGQGNSYDNETEILTENGWKYFYELDGEKVATLNQETNKLEWQLPGNEHFFDYSGEMYKIVLEDGSELLVSPQHKVYVKKEKGSNGMAEPNSLNNFPLQNDILYEPKYLKLSDSMKGSARVAEWYTRLPDKQFSLTGNAGSIPTSGAPLSSKEDFSLQQITEVYNSINNGNEIYFLNSNNEPVKVNSISKEEYNGKIYDVDVENDIILVRRDSNNEKKEKGSNGMAEPNRLNNFPPQNNISYNPKYLKLSDSMKGSARVAEWYTRLPDKQFSSTGNAGSNPVPGALSFSKKQNSIEVNGKLIDINGGIWSGNSESYSQNIFDLKILNGSVEFDYIVDPIILGNANSLNTNTTYENNFTHLNISNSSIVAYWPFDENVSLTTTYDYTNNSNDGTITGGAVYNTSQTIYGGAYTFDGVDDYIHFGSPASLNSAKITWSVWFKSADDSPQALISKYSADTSQFFTMWAGNGITGTMVDELILITRNNANAFVGYTTTTRTELFDGNWHHIVITADGTSYKIYLDGASKTLTVGQGSNDGLTAITGYNNFTIGTHKGISSFPNVSIDEVMIWNTALNSTEVLAIYNNQTNRFHGTGEMNYTGVNFAGNDTINITLAGCQQNMGTLLRAKVNNGAYVNFDSSCFIKDYNATGNLNSANVTVGFVSDANRFYTPLVIGNITLDSNPTFPTISYDPQTPADNSTINSNSIYVNVSVADANFENMSYSLYNESLNISGLVGYWNFDRNTTTIRDLSKQGKDGTRNGGVNWTTGGKLGNAMSFDGVNDVIDAGNLGLTGNWTISLWTKLSATDATVYYPIGTTASQTGIFMAFTDDKWGFYDGVDGTFLGTATNTNVWEHLVVTKSGTTYTLYKNATNEASKTLLDVDLTDFSIGRRSDNNWYFNGSIDEVMVFNRVLSSTEVSELYNRQLVNYTTYSSITESINWTSLVDNDYHYFADVMDDAENYNSTPIRWVELDTTFPTLSFANPTTNTSNLSQNFIIANLSFTEANINITNITLYNSTQNIINSTTGTTSPVYINFSGLADGTYYLNATISDTSGNKNQTETRIIGLDTTFPTITINIPSNNSFTTDTSQDVNFTVQDSNLNTCWYSNDTYTANTTLTNCNTNITTVKWAEGQHNVTVYVNDSANNVNSSMVTFTIDTTFPTFSWTDPTPADKSSISSNSTYLNVTVTDATQTSAWFDWNQSLVGYWPMDFRNSTGVYDNSSNENFGTAVGGAVFNSSGFYGGAFTFDGVNDYIEINSVLTNNLATTTKGTWSAWVKPSNTGGLINDILSFGDTDANENIRMLQTGGSTGKLVSLVNKAGTTQWQVTTDNLVFSDSTWTHVALVQDEVSPVLYVNGVAVAQTFTISTNKKIWFANLTGLDNGRIGDRNNNNAGEAGLYNGTIDEVLIFDRALSSTEILSLYNNTANRLQNNFTSLSEATYNYSAYSIDKAGNLNITSPDRQITIDTIFPTLSFASPTTNTSNLSQNFIQANVSVTEINLNTINISLFNSTQNIINSTTGTTSPVYINFSGLSDGRYYLNATVNDTAGNKNYTGTRIIGLDRVAPNLTINSPTATTYTTSTILFNATSIDLTTLVDSCWYTTNSGATNRTLSRDGTTNYYNFTQTSISDSTYTARFYCNDSANNVNNTENVAFTIDTSVPVQGGGAKSSGGTGGGAPSKPAKKRIFNLGYNMYDQTISLNQVKFDILQITNNGEITDDYTIEVKTIDNIISFEKKELHLEPGETKALEFKISSPKEPGIYTGKIIVSNGISEREVLVTINVKTEKSLFDITLTIPESLKTLLIGNNLISKIDLIQMGLKENIDVTLNYVIKDFEGQTYLSESETIAVLDQKSYEKEFFTGELPPGQYVLGTELIHPDGVAVASTHFVVQAKGFKFGKEEILLSSLILALVLVSLIIFLSIRKYKRVGRALKARRK